MARRSRNRRSVRLRRSAGCLDGPADGARQALSASQSVAAGSNRNTSTRRLRVHVYTCKRRPDSGSVSQGALLQAVVTPLGELYKTNPVPCAARQMLLWLSGHLVIGAAIVACLQYWLKHRFEARKVLLANKQQLTQADVVDAGRSRLSFSRQSIAFCFVLLFVVARAPAFKLVLAEHADCDGAPSALSAELAEFWAVFVYTFSCCSLGLLLRKTRLTDMKRELHVTKAALVLALIVNKSLWAAFGNTYIDW